MKNITPGLVDARPGSLKRMRELSIANYHQVVCSVGEIFFDWPMGWHRALERILTGEEERRLLSGRENSLWKKRSFPCALRRAMQGEAAGELLWREWKVFTASSARLPGIRYWNRHLNSVRNGSKTALACPLSSQDASPGLPPNAHAQYLTCAGARKLLGVSRGEWTGLLKAGWILAGLRLSSDSREKWRFSEGCLKEALMSWLGPLPIVPSIPRMDAGEMLNLREAVRRVRLPGLGWIDLLWAIRSGQLHAWRTPEPFNLSAIFIFKRELAAFREQLLQSQAASIYAAMKQLNCGIETLRRLEENGLLKPVRMDEEQDMRTWFYDRKDLDSFLERYLDTSSASKCIGCSRRALTEWVRNGWIQAVSGPAIDGRPFYLFEKASMLQWRRDRLVSSEARELLGISQRTMEEWVAAGKLQPIEQMGQHPCWYFRVDIEHILDSRNHQAAA